MIELIDGCILIICGVGMNDICDLVVFVKELVIIVGIDVVLVVVFYYNKLN